MHAVGRLRYLEAPPPAGQRSRGTLVLIHAFPLNARMWEPQLELAAGGWRVIAPQLRGVDGGSGDPPASSMDDYAGDVIDLLDALHVPEAVIGGLSLGGYVTLAMFRHAPRYFAGMVLADTRPQPDSAEGIENRRRMLVQVAEEGPPAVVEAMLPRLLDESTRRERPEVEEQVRSLALASSGAAIGNLIAAMMTREDSTPLLSTIHCPTLVMVGEHDAITPPAVAEEMQRAVSGAELAIVKGAGHLANLEQPAAFNRALARFLEHRL